MAQNARPLFHDDDMLVILTSRYPSHCCLHHCCNALIFAAISVHKHAELHSETINAQHTLII